MDITFNNGIRFPMIGLGTWLSSKEEVKTAVREALHAGYRHIDTAYAYRNEDAIGEVLEDFFRNGELKREEIFITTKLPAIYTRPSDVAMALDLSLKSLKLQHVDLYLIHCPVAFTNTGPTNCFPIENGKLLTDNTDLEGTWKAMEEMVRQGKATSIGVSNFNSKQVSRICDIASILPVTNQVECHPYLPQKELAEFCEKRKIVLTAYCSLGSPRRPAEFVNDKTKNLQLLDDPVVNELAEKYQKSPAQVLIRWALQRNIMVIPKSVAPSRIRENTQVFDFLISKDDMEKLGNLGHCARYFSIDLMQDHPEYPFRDLF